MFLMSASILYLVISSFLKHLAVLSGDYTYIGIMHFISLLLIGYWFYQILQFFLPMQAKNSWHQAFIGGVLVLTLGLSQAQMASGKIFFEILVDPQVQLELKTEEKEPLTLHCFPGSAYYPHCFSRTKGYVTLTELGEIYEQDKLVGYHTETWEAVSSYMMYENYAKSFTVSLAYEGLTQNLTLNYLQGRVSTEYLANPSKRSKLALFSSFKIKKYRRDYFNEKHEKVKTFEFLMVIPEDMHSAVVNQ